ncbi:hypothetical protein [Caldifermentibacillus hisashii]|uniref:hypothetical protein n=1 Tax=Caldifermentibacillus hisashii TaxID=996558 RepID=UPI001C12332F|nr:hypothetical protein [Caldifermentibacillus hisashii]MBU5342738.1 hypothetical protein [Caldifermentibacillus hisashii]
MMTKPNLVVVLRQERPNFDDETRSRHHFWSGNFIFWRRGPFSSPFLGKKRSILTTKRLLVAILGRGMLNFGDEAQSRC